MLKLFFAHKQLIKNSLFSRAAIPVFTLLMFLGLNHMSLEIARNVYYSALVRKIGRKVKLTRGMANNSDVPISEVGDVDRKRVWVYWDTGFENAPPIVRLCAARLQTYNEVEIVFLERKNIVDYVQMPSHIDQKLAAGTISKAHYSDLLRMELLYNYGGIWLDATVLLTGKAFPQELLGDDLFFYSMSKPSSNGNPIYISSWAISSLAGNPVLSIARNYLFDYWQRKNSLMDYFLFHIVLCATMNSFPEIAPERIGFHNNSSPHLLLLNFNKPYSTGLCREILAISDLHKLSYKYDEVEVGSILDHLLHELDEQPEEEAQVVKGVSDA